MSMDPNMIAQLLMGQQQQPGMQQQTGMGTAADLMRKIMMIQALKRQQQPQPPPQMQNLPGQPQPQAPAAAAMPGDAMNA